MTEKLFTGTLNKNQNKTNKTNFKVELTGVDAVWLFGNLETDSGHCLTSLNYFKEINIFFLY